MGVVILATVASPEPTVIIPPPLPPRRRLVFDLIRDYVVVGVVFPRVIAAAFVELSSAGVAQLAAANIRRGVRRAVAEVPAPRPDGAQPHDWPHIIRRLRIAFASWVIFMTVWSAMSIARVPVSTANIAVSPLATPHIKIDRPVETIFGLAVAANPEVLGAGAAGIDIAVAEPNCDPNAV